ncbi:MAG TPA: DNA-processing protein DprA [Candidatus Hydrogenedentes bacterium]|nr:DNA-processing protein DprA [Candidatus Hydrogenedentota bacterium]
MQNDNLLVLLALSLIPGMGSRRIQQFVGVLEGQGYDLSRLAVDKPEFVTAHIPQAQPQFKGVLEHLAGSSLAEARACIDRAHRSGLALTCLKDEDYPACLKEFLENAAPPVLFLYGAKSLFQNKAAAVVGTRFPTEPGLLAARRTAEALTGAGLTLVSGGAAGVDWAAHDAAVAGGGSTIIFLPEGRGRFALPHSWKTALKAGRVLLASEYLPDAPWQTYAAVSRNALIAAQSLLVCVIEPRKQGGSVLTARHAMEQGKPVFVEPPCALLAALGRYASPLDRVTDLLTDAGKENFSCLYSRPKQSKLF